MATGIWTNAGIWCWFFDGTGWGNRIDGPIWDDASGWNDFRLYTSISLGDMNNDGMADLCGRDGEQVICYLSDGAGFPTPVTGPTMRDADGWALYPYFSTLRFGGVVAPDQCVALSESDTTCDGVDDDCDGVTDEDADGACDDQDQCNGVEMCSGTGAGCVTGTPPDCGGRGCLPESGCCPEGTTLRGESCLPDSCDPGNDLCEDGNLCNGVAACNPQTLSCQTGAAPDCGDRGCLPESGCCPEGTALLDGACVETEGGGIDASGGCSCTHGRGTPPPMPAAVLILLALVWLQRGP